MKTGFRLLTVFATVASLSAGASLALAQQAPPQQEAPQQGTPDRQPAPQKPPAPSEQPAPRESTVQSISGELLSVDTEKKTLTVKPTTGAEMIFTYNDDTEISGSQENAAGLATSKGSKVTVEFKEDGGDKIATSIDVESKS